MPTKNFTRLAVALAATSVVAVSACSEVVSPITDAEPLSLPEPDTYVARDREGAVLATGRISHSPATERISWAFSHALPVRGGLMARIASYSGPDPECLSSVYASEEELAEWAKCVNRLFEEDAGCEVVVTEYFRKTGELHAHCME